MRSRLIFSLGPIAAVLVACGAAPGSEADLTESSESALTCTTRVDPARSLFVTDPTALAQFSFQRVMNAIVTSGNVGSQTSLALYKQWWDLNNDDAHGASASNPHCNDQGGKVNGFPIECPRQEGLLAATNPFAAGRDHYSPVGIVNRFDLAPRNGANCGQYRVVFAKDSGKTDALDRNLVIFEAVLPNPNPAAQLVGCTAVAQFWAGLSSDASAASRATKLASFYFTGLPGFSPVVTAGHYGIGGGSNTGQIRANQFMPGRSTLGQAWELREYRLARPCATTTSCKLLMTLASVKTNPSPELFAGVDAQSLAFQSSFLNQIPKLVSSDLNAIGMTIGGTFNAGESHEQSSGDQYETRANAAFRSRIQAKLTAIGSARTPNEVLKRASTQSCAGCHQLEAGANLGGGLTWPLTNGFVQIGETSVLSPALTTVFLPHRKQVLEAFVNAQCGAAPSLTPGDPDTTVGGSEVGAPN